MSLLTITLKLHKPSAVKRCIIDEAMADYTRAYEFLLQRARQEFEGLLASCKRQNGRLSAYSLSKWVGKDLGKELNRFNVQPFKDSLKLDFGMTMAGYLRLKTIKPGVSFPSPCPALPGEDVSGGTRPIYFCRYDRKRDYCIVYDEVRDRYFAKLHLLNCSRARPVGENLEGGRLAYVHKGGGVLARKKGKENFILVPLAFGKWQEQYLKRAVECPEILKTARLIKRGGEYFLSVSIDTMDVPKIETTSYMGVSRGLKNPVNYSINRGEGTVPERGSVTADKSSFHKGGLHKRELYRMANKIVELALKEKAQVIVEDLKEKGDRINWIGPDEVEFRPVLGCRLYNQLVEVLAYKLQGKGLPAPVKVSPVGIFHTCPQCGLNSRNNRFSRDMFICTACGTSLEIECLGSVNLADKLIKYRKSPVIIRTRRTAEGTVFYNDLLGLELECHRGSDYYLALQQEITGIMEETRASKREDLKKAAYDKRLSIIKKLEQKPDFMKMIQFE